MSYTEGKWMAYDPFMTIKVRGKVEDLPKTVNLTVNIEEFRQKARIYFLNREQERLKK